jgi:hypothetical protein
VLPADHHLAAWRRQQLEAANAAEANRQRLLQAGHNMHYNLMVRIQLFEKKKKNYNE